MLSNDFITFVAVKHKEQISSWILLSVFLPMMLFSYLHVHVERYEMIDCDACVEHMHHAGHITSQVTTVDDCLLCRFLGQQYDASSDQPSAVGDHAFTAFVPALNQQHLVLATGVVASLRAPPEIL